MIDARIAMGVQGPEIESPLNSLAKVLQVKQAQQENMLGQMKIDEARRGADETNRLNQLYAGSLGPDGSLDRTKLFQGAASQGLGSKIPGLQKTFLEADEAQGKVDAQKFKLASERHATYQKTLAALADAPGLNKDMVMQAGAGLVQQGIMPADLAEKAIAGLPDDPQQLRATLIRGGRAQMTPEQIFTVFAPKAEKIDNGQQIGFVDMNPNSRTYGRMTGPAPVQKMQTPDSMATDARAREFNAQKAEENRIKLAQGGGTGSATEAERKAATLLQRLEFSENQLETALKDNPGAAKPGLLSNGLEAIGLDALSNSTKSDARQQVAAAQLDILDAALTLGTGAAYTREQLEGYRKSYFPQVGDSQKAIEDKTARLKNVIDAAKIAAGRARPTQKAAPAEAASGIEAEMRRRGLLK